MIIVSTLHPVCQNVFGMASVMFYPSCTSVLPLSHIIYSPIGITQELYRLFLLRLSHWSQSPDYYMYLFLNP